LQVGGITAFAHYLAEDYFMNKFLYDAGKKARMAPQPSAQRVR
jgi:hypothetical protein